MYEFVNLPDDDGFSDCLRKHGTLDTFKYMDGRTENRSEDICRLIAENQVRGVHIAHRIKFYQDPETGEMIREDKFDDDPEGKNISYAFKMLSDLDVRRWMESEKDTSLVYSPEEALNYYKSRGELPKGVLNLNMTSKAKYDKVLPMYDVKYRDLFFVYDYARYEEEFNTYKVYAIFLGNNQYVYLQPNGKVYKVADVACHFINAIFSPIRGYVFQRKNTRYFKKLTLEQIILNSSKVFDVGYIPMGKRRGVIKRLSLLE